jgi:hypothetical protein
MQPSQGHNGFPVPQTFRADINGKVVEYPKALNTGEELLLGAGYQHPKCHSLYKNKEHCDFDPVALTEVIDLGNLGTEKFTVKDATSFDYTVNGEPETSTQKLLTPEEILKRAGIDPEKEYLIQVIHQAPDVVYAFTPDAKIQLLCPGPKFITKPWVDTVNIEDYGKKCQEVPVAHFYKARIQDKYYTFNSPYQTGKSIITATDKDPAKYDLLKFSSNSAMPVKVGLDEDVDLTQLCLIRFVLQPKEQTDGRTGRREFELQAEDAAFLEKQGLLWESLVFGTTTWLYIYDYPIPDGYNVTTCTLALRIPPQYPVPEIDMAYFMPALARKDGRQLHAVTTPTINGQVLQQWSRHRAAGDWQPGIDNLSTHLFLVKSWLIKELTR